MKPLPLGRPAAFAHGASASLAGAQNFDERRREGRPLQNYGRRLQAKASRGVRIAEALASSAGEHPSRALADRWPGLIRREVALCLLDRAREDLRVDCRRSLLLAQGATAIAACLDDRRLLGESLRAQGNAQSISGNNQAALDLDEQALALLEAERDDVEIARTLSASVQPLILLGQYDRALSAAERARALFAAHGDEVPLSRLEINVGNIYHRQDRYDEALACYERAYAQLAPLHEADGMFSALHNKAVTLIVMSRFQEALTTYAAARQISVELERPHAILQTDYNIAWLHYLRGDYSRAIDLLHLAADASAKHGDAYHAALALLDLSEIYLELNLSDDARETAQQATARFRGLGMGYELAKAVANTAIAHGQEGKAIRASELFAEARDLFVKEQNSLWPSLIDLYQALLLFNEGRLFEARRLCVAALAVFAESSRPTKAALCHLLLARINLALREADAARADCERALDLLARIDAPPVLRYHASFLLGQVQAAAGDRNGARASYESAREALESLRSRLRSEELKIAFVKNKVEVYERLVDVHLQDGGDAALREAFACIEHAKSRTLLDLIFQPVHAFAQLEAGASQLARTIRELREELNWYYHLIELEQLRPGDRSPQRLEDFQRHASARERELARTLREVGAADRQSELHAPTIFQVDEVRRALPGDAVLLEFFQLQDRIVLCVLDRTSLCIAPVTVESRVSTHVRMLQFQFSKFRLGAEYVNAFRAPLLEATRAHLQALFHELLAPAWAQLRGRPLVIVPHGILHYVPFHALHDGTEYVVDACPVSYAPSASIYTLCQQRPPVTGGPALVMGVPDARAPHIEAEARAVAEVLPESRLFVGEQATGQVLRANSPDCRIVHIASHGYFRPDNPMFSGIRLGDGYLNVYDLYHLQMPAELVTLSGCATGATIAAAGDELLGIARGLFLAGARSLLLSLWDIHDESTAAFMRTLYGAVARSTPPVQALRDTMREVRQEYPHPYYWASFVLTGRI